MNYICLFIFIFFLLPYQNVTASADSTQTSVIYLSGKGPDDAVKWDFFCTSGRNSGKWTQIDVPSCWEQQGFGEYCYGVNFYGKVTAPGLPNEQGLYKHTFDAPESWRGKRIRLVFDGVMTDARVLINGVKVGNVHQGGFYRFSYEITNYLKYGKSNVLEVTVSKESENSSINLAERRADYWNFGGIFRPVFLEILPSVFISRTAIYAKADGSFHAEVFCSEGINIPLKVNAQIIDPAGKIVDSPIESTISNGKDRIALKTSINSPKLWTAETPNLYQVKIQITLNEKIIHTVSQRFGFRSFEIRKGDGFYLNSKRILLKGVNRHSFRPETGRTLSREQNYEDVRLIKAMNMNTVRMSHYPPNPEFLDACDELGLYVLNELGGWHGKYDTGVGIKLVEELVTRDVNHPCILFWDNGNEGGWNTELDGEFARWDPQNRPVLHPQQLLNGVETMHYRSYGETQEYLRGNYIFFPTEFLHGLYDGGLGAGLRDYWEMMSKHPRCGGGLLWVFADEGVVRTDLNGKIDNDGNHGADGILGPNGEKEASFYTIKEVWSPVVILNNQLNENFNGILEIENRYDFTNLNTCQFEWKIVKFQSNENNGKFEIIKSGKQPGTNIMPHSTGRINLNINNFPDKADGLILKIANKYSEEILTKSWLVEKQEKNISSPVKSNLFKEEKEKLCIVKTDALTLAFSRGTGYLEYVEENGKRLSFGQGPRFIAFRRADRHFDGWTDADAPKGVDRLYKDVSGTEKLISFKTEKLNDKVVVMAIYEGSLKKVKWEIVNPQNISMEYEYDYDGVVDLMGIKFGYPEDKIVSKRWLGNGPYRVWQNRLDGVNPGIWETDYNDPVPGETFLYPEFKGFFANWKWMEFTSEEGKFQISQPLKENYIGVYSPRDGRDALLYTFPESGISILDVIPAVRNKVNTTDLIGPASKPKTVEGVKSGRLSLRFLINAK